MLIEFRTFVHWEIWPLKVKSVKQSYNNAAYVYRQISLTYMFYALNDTDTCWRVGSIGYLYPYHGSYDTEATDRS